MQTHVLICFLGKTLFGDDYFWNMFINQHSALELKEDKNIKYVIGWKSRGVYTSKCFPSYTAFLPSMKLSWNKVKIPFNNSVLVVEQNSYVTKFVNAYIVYDLENWSRILLSNFELKNYCLVRLI